jgi:hypothetical protein
MIESIDLKTIMLLLGDYEQYIPQARIKYDLNYKNIYATRENIVEIKVCSLPSNYSGAVFRYKWHLFQIKETKFFLLVESSFMGSSPTWTIFYWLKVAFYCDSSIDAIDKFERFANDSISKHKK